MINLYHFLYAKLYFLSVRANGRRDWLNNFHACLMLSVSFLFNFATVALLTDIFFYANFIAESMSVVSKYEFFSIFVCLCLVHFFYFSIHGRYKKVIARIDSEKRLASPNFYLGGVFYIIGSATLFIFTLVLFTHAMHQRIYGS